MTTNEADEFFRNYLMLITGRDAVLAPYRGPQKHVPYLTYKVFDSDDFAYDIENKTCSGDEPDVKMHSGMRGLTLVEYEIVAIGGDSLATLRRLKSSFRSTIFLDKLVAEEFGGFGLSDISNITDTSAALINSKFEDRHQVSISFYIPLSQNFDIDHYDHNNYRIREESKQYDKTITVPNNP